MTIFEKLISGEWPCHKLYEDDYVFAFLDLHPLSEGHALLVPKQAVARLDELSEESGEAIGRVLPRLARALKHATGVSDYNILQNNGRRAHQEIEHVHFHLIPKPNEDEGLTFAWKTRELHIHRAEALAARVSEEMFKRH